VKKEAFMAFNRSLVALFATSVLVAQEATVKISAAEAKTLVQDFCYGPEKKKAAARAKLESARPEDRKEIFSAFAAVKFKPKEGLPPPKGRRARDTIEMKEAEVGFGTFIVVLPSRYDPAKSWPVVFRFHGSGDDCENFSRGWESVKTPEECVAVVPEIPTKSRTAWNDEHGQRFVDRLYREILRRYNVDTNRVYYSGFSAGGGAAPMLAGLWPERCAGIYGAGRHAWAFHVDPKGSAAVIARIPAFFVVGQKDAPDRVASYRDAEPIAKELGAPWTFHYPKGLGHDYPFALDKEAFATLFKSRRDPYPKEFSTIFFSYGGSVVNDLALAQFSLRCIRGDLGAGVPCGVKIEGNVVAVTGSRLFEGALLLNDALVDLDKPVVVTLDGAEVFNGVVERDVKFLLDGFDACPDPRRVFFNEVKFKRK
jgi:predicted esterase